MQDITGKRVVLKPWSVEGPEFAERVRALVARGRREPLFYGDVLAVPPETLANVLREAIKGGQAHFYSIHDRKTGGEIGSVRLTYSPEKFSRAGLPSHEIGVEVAAGSRRSGYGADAVHALMTHFETRGVGAFLCRTHAENPAAVKLVKRLGFKEHPVRDFVMRAGRRIPLRVFRRN
ncbi:TPA: GNAT family N-acetyltransferase [Candidatus Micrarchaeota archaeon]|nr:GNAT family N-acetyltransferase [Candidatus Micrarchaeota archaeon]